MASATSSRASAAAALGAYAASDERRLNPWRAYSGRRRGRAIKIDDSGIKTLACRRPRRIPDPALVRSPPDESTDASGVNIDDAAARGARGAARYGNPRQAETARMKAGHARAWRGTTSAHATIKPFCLHRSIHFATP